eukprot:1069891-Prorocentrum_minimum.AAC.2
MGPGAGRGAVHPGCASVPLRAPGPDALAGRGTRAHPPPADDHIGGEVKGSSSNTDEATATSA